MAITTLKMKGSIEYLRGYEQCLLDMRDISDVSQNGLVSRSPIMNRLAYVRMLIDDALMDMEQSQSEMKKMTPYVFQNLLGFKTYEPPKEKWEMSFRCGIYKIRRVKE